jgi:hypothetical protein
MGTKKGQRRKTARRAYERKYNPPKGYEKAYARGWREETAKRRQATIGKRRKRTPPRYGTRKQKLNRGIEDLARVAQDVSGLGKPVAASIRKLLARMGK